MKAKLNLDQAKIKQFFLLHSEKIVFAGVLVCFLLLCYSALNRQPYQQRPEDLVKLAADRDQLIKDSPVDAAGVGLQVPPYTELVNDANREIDPRPYALKPFDPAPAELKVRRGEPQYLALREPIAVPGYGAIAWSEQGGHYESKGPPAGGAGAQPGGAGGGMEGGMGMGGGQGMGEMMRGSTGQMGAKMRGSGMADPSKMGEQMRGGQAGAAKQKDRDRKKKKDADEDKTNIPTQTPAERAEQRLVTLPANAQAKGVHWVAVMGLVPTWDQAAEYRKVFQNATAVRSNDDMPFYLNLEVERWTDGEWLPVEADRMLMEFADHYAASHPEVIDPSYVEPLVCDPIPPVVSKNLDPRSVSHPQIPLAAKFAAPVPAVAEKQEKEDKDAAADKTSPRRRSAARGATGRAAKGSRARGGISAPPPQRVVHKQFRFFDFGVEPGKTYRYRVRLVLFNPNFGVATRYLQKPELAEDEVRTTPWSEPTLEVFVKRGSTIFAGEVNPPSGSKDATVTLMVSQFDQERGVEVARPFNAPRGTYGNFVAEEVAVASPHGRPSLEKVHFDTDTLVVDFAGGNRLAGKAKKSPGLLLLLGPDGKLAIRSQVKDATSFEAELKRQEDLKKRAKDSDEPADKDEKKSDPFSDFKNLKPGGGKKSQR